MQQLLLLEPMALLRCAGCIRMGYASNTLVPMLPPRAAGTPRQAGDIKTSNNHDQTCTQDASLRWLRARRRHAASYICVQDASLHTTAAAHTAPVCHQRIASYAQDASLPTATSKPSAASFPKAVKQEGRQRLVCIRC